MSGTNSSVSLVPGRTSGMVVQDNPLPLTGATGVYSTVPNCTVTLPAAGTYELWCDVRGRVTGTPPFADSVTARLFNVTAAAAVANSDVAVIRHQDVTAAAAGQVTAEATGCGRIVVTVTAATTIRLEAARVTNTAAAPAGSAVAVVSDGTDGYTRLGYVRIA